MKRIIWPASFFLLAVIAYLPSAGFGYLSFDDQIIYLGQPELFDVGFVDGLSSILTKLPREEPLLVRDLSWLLDSTLFGFGNPFGQHLGNALIYGVVCALAFSLLSELGLPRPVLFSSALLFTLHPVHMEPVLWVMGRKDVLSTAFVLSALLVYLRGCRSGLEPSHRALWLGLALGLHLAAMLSKINVVVMPALMLPLYLLARRRGENVVGLRAAAASSMPFFLASALVLTWYGAQLEAFGVRDANRPSLLEAQHLGHLARLVPAELGVFGARLLVPFDYLINYDRPTIGVPISPVRVGAGLFVIALGVGSSLFFLRRRPEVSFMWFGAGVTIAPYLNIEFIGVVVPNRYLLLPSLFLIPLVVLTLWSLRRYRFGVWSFAVVWTLVAAIQVARAYPAWASDQSYWAYEASTSQPSLLSYRRHAWHLTEAAVREPRGSAARAEGLREALAVIEEGLSYFSELSFEDVPGYRSYPRHYYSRLLAMKARALHEGGAPLEVSISWQEAAEKAWAGKGFPFFANSASLYFAKALEARTQGAPYQLWLERGTRAFERLTEPGNFNPKDAPLMNSLLTGTRHEFPEWAERLEAVAARHRALMSKGEVAHVPARER